MDDVLVNDHRKMARTSGIPNQPMTVDEPGSTQAEQRGAAAASATASSSSQSAPSTLGIAAPAVDSTAGAKASEGSEEPMDQEELRSDPAKRARSKGMQEDVDEAAEKTYRIADEEQAQMLANINSAKGYHPLEDEGSETVPEEPRDGAGMKVAKVTTTHIRNLPEKSDEMEGSGKEGDGQFHQVGCRNLYQPGRSTRSRSRCQKHPSDDDGERLETK